MVLLGAMRQWARILLTFTRPYLGTASSMSKTLAVSTYSGGSSSSEWMERRPDLRSRLSCARWMRIWLARASASILWLSDRSGAVDVFVDVVPVAVAMGRESTHRRGSMTKKSLIHLNLNLRLRCVEVGGRYRVVFAGVFGPLKVRAIITSLVQWSPRLMGRESSPFRPPRAWPRQPSAGVRGRRSVPLPYPLWGCLHARPRRPPGRAPRGGWRGRRARRCHPPATRLRRGCRGERHGAQRVDQRDGVRSAFLCGQGAQRHVGGVGCELDDQRLGGALAHGCDDGLELRRGRRRCPGRCLTLGQDTFSSMAAISARASHACTSWLSSSALEPITLVISGTGQDSPSGEMVCMPASCGRSSVR